MNPQFKRFLQKFRKRVLLEKFYFNRGKSLMSDFIELITLTAATGLLTTQINARFHTNLDTGMAMIFGAIVYVWYWVLGRLDVRKLHIIQIENEIALQANPALYDKICRIDETLKELKDKK